jgi:phenylacetate-coenzyme A ligase PaaK-like adenylate-forming protein
MTTRTTLFAPRLSRRWDHLDGELLRSLQFDRLRHYLSRDVLPFSKHYGELFAKHGIELDDLRRWDDWEDVPFTSKRDLVGAEGEPMPTRDFVIAPKEEALKRRPSTIARALFRGAGYAKDKLAKEYRPILMTSTTGRSSDPVPFLYTQHDLDNLKITGRRMMEICESQPEFRHLNLFPYAPHLAFWQTHYAGLGYTTFCLSSGGGKVMGTEGNVRMLDKIQPDAVIGMPTFIYHVLAEAVADGLRVDTLKRVVLGGEKVPDGMRRKLRALCAALGSTRVDVMATYGFTEAKMAWPECPVRDGGEPSGYHLSPDLGLIEIIDPDSGRSVGEGEPGEIVFTPLDSRGSVVLRYRTGDHISGGLLHDKCPHCGRLTPRLVGRISRVSDIRRLHIDKIKGTLVNFNDLEHLLDDMDEIGAWQIEIRKRNDDPLECDELVVHVDPAGNSSTDTEALRRRIVRRFRKETEISPNAVEFHDAETLRDLQGVGVSLKEDKVIDRRPQAAAPAVATATEELAAT